MLTARSFSLSNLDAVPAAALDVWREEFRAAPFPNTLYPIGPGPFRACMQGVRTTHSILISGRVSPSRTVVSKANVENISQRCLQLMFVPEHGGIHCINGQRFEVPGDVLFVEQFAKDRSAERMVPSNVTIVHPDPELLSLTDEEIRSLCFRPLKVNSSLKALMLNAIASSQVFIGNSEVVLDRYVASIAEVILREFLPKDGPPEATMQAMRSQVLDFMRSHAHDQGLSADSLARSLGISRRRLYQLFPEDQTPMQVLRHIRAQRALDDIHKNQLSRSEIAARQGFSDTRQLNRAVLDYLKHEP
ncbi:MAG: helix-turn-helix domain-containing protein [Mycobacteriaceae bacterium]